MPIHKLPPLLVNQIAAGEVIERPASVVKELIENSLDAGASSLDVAVEEGGRQLIRVRDDGCGVPNSELALAVAPHATSKLADAESLGRIATLGFRGEALASIASVSRLRLTSRGSGAEEAWELEASGDQVSDPKPAAGPPGTVLEVRDLFFNTPARRKFLRAASTEMGHVSDCLTRIAMVSPDVAFSLTHNGRKAMQLSADRSPRQRCLELMGAELDEALLEFEHQDADLHVWGLAGLPSIARATGKFQYVAVNGRPVRDRNLTHAVREAYRGLMPPDRQAVCVLMLEMDSTELDVNVHPTKAEVRFSNPSRVHSTVLTAVRQRLLSSDLTPAVALSGAAAPASATRSSSGALDPQVQETSTHTGGGRTDPSWPARGPAGNGGSRLSDGRPDPFVESFRRMGSDQKGFDFDQVRRSMAGDEAQTNAAATVSPTERQDTSLPPVLQSQDVLQVHRTYLVTEDEQGILIVDQHALHERVMFEQLKQRIAGRNLESQRLLMPALVESDPKRMALLEPLGPLLKRIGIEAEAMGPHTLAIQAFPSFLFERKVEPPQFLDELLDQVEDGRLDPESATTEAEEATLHRVLDMMACKAAVKAGDALQPQELAALLAQRDRIERSSACPHGRPTSIRLSLKDLERHFKRT